MEHEVLKFRQQVNHFLGVITEQEPDFKPLHRNISF